MLVSIVVPVYNAQKYLETCILSILGQTFSDWELLLINDGSTDCSEKICLSFADRDPRIRYFRKTNGGVSSARNYGLQNACGQYVTFVDADDYLDPAYLSNLVDKTKEDSVSLVVRGIQYAYPDGRIQLAPYRLKRGCYSGKELRQVIVDDGTLSGFTFHSACAVLFCMSRIREENLLFNENLRFNEDGLFVTAYCLQNSDIVADVDLSSAMYYYRINEESASNNIDIQKYVKDMSTIEKVLHGFGEVIDSQIEMRKLTTAIDLLLLYKSQDVLSYKTVKKNLNCPEIQKAVSSLSIKKQKAKKKIFGILLKMRAHFLIYLILKYV